MRRIDYVENKEIDDDICSACSYIDICSSCVSECERMMGEIHAAMSWKKVELKMKKE